MRSMARRAAGIALRELRVAQNVGYPRFASYEAASPAARAAGSTGPEGMEGRGDPGPSSVQHAKAHRRKLHAQLMSFSESAKESSVSLETFNDILSPPPPPSPSRSTRGRESTPRPTLADSTFALPKGKEVIVDETEAGMSGESHIWIAEEQPVRARRISREGRPDWATREGTERKEDGGDTFRRVKDGPYALSARLRAWISNHPTPLSTPQVEELISMVSQAPKGDINEVVWGQVFAVLGREKKLDRMWRAYNDMKKSGIKPSLRTYTTLLNAYASVPHSSSLVTAGAIEQIPEGRTLSRVAIIYRQSQDHITSLRPVGDPTADSGLSYPSFALAGQNGADEVGIHATNAYLKFLARYGMYQEAETIFREMLAAEERSARPDSATIATLFTALLNARQRQVASAKEAQRSKVKQSKNLKTGTPPLSPRRRNDISTGLGQPAEGSDSPGRFEPIRVKRQFPRAGTFQHRPKVSFGMRQAPQGESARAYATLSQASSTGITFDGLVEHVKAHHLASPPPLTPPMGASPTERTPEHVRPRKYVHSSGRARYAPFDPTHDRSRRDRALRSSEARPEARPEGRHSRGKPIPRATAPAEPHFSVSSTPDPPIDIGRKARWLWTEALSILRPSSNGGSLDSGIAILAIQCFLKGRPEDQRYAVDLIPRLFNLPSLPSSASPPLSTAEGAPPPDELPILHPTPAIATSLVSSLSRANRPTLATHYATIFRSSPPWSRAVSKSLDVAFYSTMIHALANTGDIHPILDILESRSRPSRGGKSWPLYVYCEGLTAARWAGDWEAAKRVWGLMEAEYSLRGPPDAEGAKEMGPSQATATQKTRVDSKAMSLLLKSALAKGKRATGEAMEIFAKYGESYDFGQRMGAERRDALMVLNRKMRRSGSVQGQGERGETSEEKAQGGNAWSQELRVDVQRAKELLASKPPATPASAEVGPRHSHA